MFNPGFIVSVIKCCPRLCGGSFDRNLCVDGELGRFLWHLMKTVYVPASVPLQYDLPALFTARERDCKGYQDCGFQSLFGHYIVVDVRSQLSVFDRACQKLWCGVVEGTVRLMCDRRAYLCSSPFDPVLIKFNTQARLTDALSRLCQCLVARRLMEAGTAADALQQYLVVKRWVLTEIGSGGDDLPVVDDVVALWMAFPHWAECLEFLHVLLVVFVSCCLPEYDVNFPF